MAFDFPSSPSIGTVSNGFVYNGMGWAGGPVPVAGQPTEQFFKLDGQSQFDIAVPDWAKYAVLEGVLWHATTATYSLVSISTDGTTFYGAVHALAGGIVHKVVGGYATQAAVLTATGFYISMPAGNLNIPPIFNCTMTLELGAGNQVFGCRSEFQNYDATAAATQYIWEGYFNGGALAAGTRVKKMRIFVMGGATTWQPGTWVKVRWLGDNSALPQTNAIPDSPQDGGEYVRCNGVWRLRKQEVSMSGLMQADVAVPDWDPKLARVYFNTCTLDTTAYAMVMRCSHDGTNFLAGATDYYNAAIYAQAAAVGNALYTPATAYTYAYISYSGNNASVPNFGTVDVALERAGGTFVVNSTASHYGANGYGITVNANYLSGGFGAVQRLKALRLIKNGGGVMSAGSRMIVEWL